MHSHKCGFGLFLLFTLINCQTQPQSVRFLNGQYSLIRPATWNNLDDLNENADVQLGQLSQEAYMVILGDAKVDFAQPTDIEAHSETTRASLLSSLEDVTVSEPENITINEMNALRYTLHGSIGNIRIKYWHVTIDAPDHFLQILLWSLPSKFDDNQSNFNSVLNSIRQN